MWKPLERAATALGSRPLRCGFCRRSAAEVGRLVAGASAYICDTCIRDCVAILQDHGGFDTPGTKRTH